MAKIDLQDSQVIFNPRTEADGFKNRNASCSFCNSYVPAVVKLPEEVQDWNFNDIFICASCLNVLVKKLEAEMVENMKTYKADSFMWP